MSATPAQSTVPARRRWCRPTPGCIAFVLLLMEGSFWLSERLGCFAFNRHKGWTVLFASAAFGVTVLLMLTWFGLAMVFRWRFQFSVRSLLILLLAAATQCSWLATEKQRAQKQRMTVEAILAAGGEVGYDYDYETMDQDIEPSGRVWLLKLVPRDLLDVPVAVANPPDDQLDRLAEIEALRWLALAGPQATDSRLGHLTTRLVHLRRLSIEDSTVTDAGLKCLKDSHELRVLSITRAGITDSGIRHLKGLNQLARLVLEGTKVTEKGVKELQEALPKCEITYSPETAHK